MQNYPEVYSLDKSLAILDKYKNDLTIEQYSNIKSNICGHAIENMFANEKDILNCIRVEKKEATANEIITQYKKEWKIL